MIWYSHLFQNFPQFLVTHTVKTFGIVNKAEIDVCFLELACFFNDPGGVGSLISGSSAFSKTSLNIWKFTVDILLKPSLENFDIYTTSIYTYVYIHARIYIHIYTFIYIQQLQYFCVYIYTCMYMYTGCTLRVFDVPCSAMKLHEPFLQT